MANSDVKKLIPALVVSTFVVAGYALLVRIFALRK